MRFQANITFPDLEDFKNVDVARAHSYAADVALNRYFLKDRMRKRFDDSLKSALGYKARGARYVATRSKRVKGKATFDHNFTGKTFQHVMRNARVWARRNRDGRLRMSIRIPGMPDQYEIRIRGNRPNLNAELTRTTQEERVEIATRYGIAFADYLSHAKPKTRKART